MFNNYPYTDYHELNTDWIISKIKNVETAEANSKQYAEDADAAKVAAEDAKDIAVQAKDDAVQAKDDAEDAKDYVQGTKAQLDLLQARVDNIIPDGTQTAGNTELLDIRVAYDGTTYLSAGDAVRAQAKNVSDSVGEWYHEKTVSSEQHPYFETDDLGDDFYFKLVSPAPYTTQSVKIYGSSDGWQTDTLLYQNDDSTEYIANINSSGYTSLRFVTDSIYPYSGTYSAIIHKLGDSTLSQEAVENIERHDALNNTYISTVLMTGTNNSGYYLNTGRKQCVKSIANTNFNVREYTLEKGKCYCLKGKNIALNASYPLAVCTTQAFAANTSVDMVLLNASSSPANYDIRYIPDEDCNLFVAWITGKNELSVYETAVLSESRIDDVLGEWLHKKTVSSEQYPYIQIDDVADDFYFKLINPVSDYTNSVKIYGSSDGWQTDTLLYQNDDVTEYNAHINSSGYNSLRFVTDCNYPFSGTYTAIIHEVDDHSIVQETIDNANKLNDLNAVYFPDNLLTGTNNSGYYLENGRKKTVRTIANTNFNVRVYTVERGKCYCLKGKNVAINASYPLAVYTTQSFAADASAGALILNGTSTPTDYDTRFVPDADGYIFVAWITGKNELGVYDTAVLSEDYLNQRIINKKAITVQTFGDSITDNYNNTWLGHTTWLDYIDDIVQPFYDLTVINSAYGGSSLSNHGTEPVTSRVPALLDNSADIVVIFAGTNDWAGGNAPIGSMTDADTTIKGALHDIIEYISTNSTAAVIVATPIQRYNSVDATRPTNADGEPLNALNLTLKDVCDAIQEVCDFYGIDCIRMDQMAGFNRINIGSFASDGLHPSTVAGNSRIGSIFADEFRKMIF